MTLCTEQKRDYKRKARNGYPRVKTIAQQWLVPISLSNKKKILSPVLAIRRHVFHFLLPRALRVQFAGPVTKYPSHDDRYMRTILSFPWKVGPRGHERRRMKDTGPKGRMDVWSYRDWGVVPHARESMKLRSARLRHIRLLGLCGRTSVRSPIVLPLGVQGKFRDKSNVAGPQLCPPGKQDFHRNDRKVV